MEQANTHNLLEDNTQNEQSLKAAQVISELPASVTNSEQFRRIMLTMGMGVMLIEIGEIPQLLYVSKAYETLFGEIPDNIEFVLSRVHPEDRVLIYRALLLDADKSLSANITIRVYNTRWEIRSLHIQAARVLYKDSANPVVVIVTSDVTALKRKESVLQENIERLKIAFDQTSQILWEVDIPTRTFAVFDLDNQSYDEKNIYPNFPESLISKGVPHPSSKDALLKFCEDILHGSPKGSGAFITRYYRTGIYGWTKMSYRTLFDSAGQPIKAIGVAEEIPSVFNEQARMQQEEILFEVLRWYNAELLVADLTADSFRYISQNEKMRLPTASTYSQFSEQSLHQTFSESDASVYSRFLPGALIEAYAKGRTWIEGEFRCLDSEGNVCWVACTANLIVDPNTRALLVYYVRRNIDKRRRWELSLPQKIERDTLTLLYTQPTAEALITSLLHAKEKSLANCFLAVVELNGLEKIAENLGQEAANQGHFFICRLMRKLLDHECIVGQTSSDHIVLFWPEMPSPVRLRTLLMNTLKTIRKVRESSGLLRQVYFTVGVSGVQSSKVSFERLFSRASYVCDQNRNSHQDTIAFYDDFVPNDSLRMNMDNVEGMAETNDDEILRPLTPEEKEVLLACLMKLPTSNNFRKAIVEILGILGSYYESDRVSLLALAGDRDRLDGVVEWTAEGKPSLLEEFSGMLLQDTPIFKNTMEKKKAILVRETQDILDNYEDWRFICCPILEDNIVVGFICVENPRKHGVETALLSILAPITGIGNVKVKSCSKGKDNLTGLWDANTYTNVLDALNVDALASMGVLYMDVNGLRKVSKEFGFEYGNSLLIAGATALSDVFQNAQIFRVSGHAFLVLYRDVTHSVFFDKCKKLQKHIDERHPGKFSIGYTWADRDFTVRKLVSNAENIMTFNKRIYQSLSEEKSNLHNIEVASCLQEWKEALAMNRYTVFVQPKTRLTDGETIGGEALVRYRGADNRFVTPIDFIGRMEQEHVIRELDFFVLEHLLKKMQQWQMDGIQLIPISVNFSRQTLLDRSALVKTLRLLRKYDISSQYIEIEITETLGKIERKTITEAVERFKEYGFQFSLDDFGSEYSSISLLSEIPFDVVKLDKSIINNFSSNAVSRCIVESMVRICNEMGAVCIAEGVETEEHVTALLNVGCQYGQGYYYNKPLPMNEFEAQYLVKESL